MLTSVTISVEGMGTETFNSSMTYDSGGRQVLTVTDCNGDNVRYSYNSTMRLLCKARDTQGETTYSWNNTNDRLVSVSRDGTDGTSVVQYTYDDAGILTRRDHDGFSYTFTYDAFGNTTSVKAANRILVTKEYLTNNGQLLR